MSPSKQGKSAQQAIADVRVVIIMGTFVPQLLDFFYRPLEKVFRERGYEVEILAIPKLGLGDMNAARRALEVQIFSAYPEARFIFVGHSQGGIHVEDLRALAPHRVLMTHGFGVPFHGTRIASLGRVTSFFPAVRGMRAHSTHLQTVRGAAARHDQHVHSYFTVFDELVVPFFASALHGAHNVIVAPKMLHHTLIALGFRRSKGIELIDGFAEHIFIIWNQKLHAHIHRALDALEAEHLEVSA